MKTRKSVLVATLLSGAIVLVSKADNNALWFNLTNGLSAVMPTAATEQITRDADNVYVMTTEGQTYNIKTSELVDATPGSDVLSDCITIDYDGLSSRIGFPMGEVPEGISVSREGTKVVITSTAEEGATFRLRGTTDNGAFKIYSVNKFNLVLDNLNLTASESSAINIQSESKASIKLVGTSTIKDATKYVTAEGEKEKGAFYCNRKLEFSGDGTLSIYAYGGHGLSGDKTITVKEGSLNICAAAKDGIHASDAFIMDGGCVSTKETGGDGIDADEGYIEVNGGTIELDIAAADTKGLKCDGDMTINDGSVRMKVPGSQAKGMKCASVLTVNGGTIDATLSGDAVLEALDNGYDPSYCSLVKTQDFTMNGGTITATHTGKAGKGISVDGNAVFNGGDVNITTSGNGDTYTDSTGTKDAYSSTCITVDGNLEIHGGNFTLLTSGSAGKCLKADGTAGFDEGVNPLNISAKTTGNRITVSANAYAPGGGGWPGGGGGGPGDQGDYSNPKAVKVEGNLTVNGGTFDIATTGDGGEGLESKDTMTINGGEITLNCKDDAINAANAIVINGGKTYALSSGNDAIDSNGTIEITGGTVIAVGTKTPECGLDCDNNSVQISGGTVVAIGGDTSPIASSNQCYITYGHSSQLSSGTLLTLVAGDSHVMSIDVPQATGSKVVVSSPLLAKGQSVTFYTGGTVSDGTTFGPLTTGGTYTPGTSASTGTLSSSSWGTTLGSSGGGGRPR